MVPRAYAAFWNTSRGLLETPFDAGTATNGRAVFTWTSFQLETDDADILAATGQANLKAKDQWDGPAMQPLYEHDGKYVQTGSADETITGFVVACSSLAAHRRR